MLAVRPFAAIDPSSTLWICAATRVRCCSEHRPREGPVHRNRPGGLVEVAAVLARCGSEFAAEGSVHRFRGPEPARVGDLFDRRVGAFEYPTSGFKVYGLDVVGGTDSDLDLEHPAEVAFGQVGLLLAAVSAARPSCQMTQDIRASAGTLWRHIAACRRTNDLPFVPMRRQGCEGGAGVTGGATRPARSGAVRRPDRDR